MKGNKGIIADINLSSNAIGDLKYPPELYAAYIGGSGMAAKLYLDLADLDADPLSPGALLIFMNGPMAGVRLSGASRMSAAARSPLTGTFADSSCGGYFAPALKRHGFDGLVIRGRIDKPSLLVIEDNSIAVEDAGDIWGSGNYETLQMLKDRYGKNITALTIGPAGEKMVSYSCILNDAHHAFGRCGIGAVMGSKKIKAIVIRNKNGGEIDFADPDRLAELRKSLTLKVRESIISQVLHDFGSSGNLEGHIYTGDVPIRNWTSNFNEEMGEALTGSTLTDKYLVKAGACAYCVVACKRIVKVDEGPYTLPESPGPEYETTAAFGTLLGSDDLAAVCKANSICNDLGLDTISAGSTIAWAMEAWERGDLDSELTGGIPLEWGDMNCVINVLLPAIASRQGELGQLLADGSLSAARKIKKNTERYTVQSKGLEAPMHDPRGGGHGHALAYAISPRGACHVATAMHFMETGACNYPEIGFEFDLEAMTHEKKAETMVLACALGMIENSACFCQYADRSFTINEMVELLNAVAGYGLTVETLMEAGTRIFHLKKCINYQLGFRAADDSLTERMLEPARDGEPEGVEINFSDMKSRFYSLMRIDPAKGVAIPDKLQELGLGEESKLIWG
ncbi:MAG: aldehyde ferredoxin oxidoreductase family protein [Dethiobacteria bacterium]|nr:aldehyde ferredoxin oxidoreductase family protein [Dethiobacteria bacterium]